ncbi:hypothetical protein Fmac_012902 [Flemingia macrophylla]|uniref:Uncharacterized protein n=1 Tax=Flemingia macrophylla TaxID=520843 RepID=A0ABD1MRM2_9FABA
MASRTCLVTKSQYSHTSRPTRTCTCSPTKHPGSFRCSMHKKPPRGRPSSTMAAKVNSLKAVLLQMLKPPSHDLHRRKTFQPKPSRFSLINGNAGVVAVN